MKGKKKVALFVALCLAIAMMVGLTVFASPVSAEDLNGWHQTEDGKWYYYESGSACADGIYWIKEKPYYFDADGVMANGEWLLLTEGWYYAQPGGALAYDEVIRIGGALYGFDTNCIMFDNQQFSLSMDDEWIDYRAKAGGALYENEWYLFSEEYDHGTYTAWYYYGENGAAPHGYAVVGGTPYLFWYGEMYEGPGIYSDEEENTYFVAANGYTTKINANGWTYAGNEWYYAQDGELYAEGVYLIDGSYYAFEGQHMVAGDEYSVYDHENDTWTYYRAKSNGSLYRNEWYYDGWDYCYYGADGVQLEDGVYLIGGNWYVFESGYMQKNRTLAYDGYVYVLDRNGYSTYTKNGWILNNYGEWIYVDDGVIYEENGLREINGVIYGFEYGSMASDTWIHDYRIDEYYLIDKNGVWVQTPGWHTGSGEYVYVREDGTLATGWQEIGGTRYYLYPWMEHSTLELEYYYDDETGRYAARLLACATGGAYTEITADGLYRAIDGLVMVENGKVLMAQWRLIDGNWYYFNAEAEIGFSYINGEMYYFDQSGRMVSGGWVQYNSGEWLYAQPSGALLTGKQADMGYIFDGEGRMLYDDVLMDGENLVVLSKSGAIVYDEPVADGWVLADGKWYYIIDGELAYGEWFIGDSWYFLDYEMNTDLEYGSRYFGADGRCVTGWYLTQNGEWFYADEDGYRYDYGEYTIGDKDYLFIDYVLQVNKTVEVWGMIYTTNASGEIVSRDDNSIDYVDGWNYETYGTYGEYGDAVYYLNGAPYTGWVGDRYVKNGYMILYTVENIDGKTYFFKEDGNLARNEWITEEYQNGPTTMYQYAYAGVDGVLYQDQWMLSGGNWYYFDGFVTVCWDVITIDGVRHEFDENSVWVGEYVEADTSMAGRPDGWNLVDGRWFYVMAGQPYYGEVYVGGTWYFCEPEGMVANDFGYGDYIYYYGPSGARAAYTGWQIINGRWVYFNTDHSVATGWITVGNTNYYIDAAWDYTASGMDIEVGMVTGYYAINERLFHFDASGACTGEIVTDGWYLAGSDWYYFEDGYLRPYEIIWDGSAYYRMGEEGKMATNVCYDGMYFGADGKAVMNGWALTEDGWIYIKEGVICSGAHRIDGTVYYFKPIYM